MQILIIEDEVRAANQLERLLASCNFEYVLLSLIDTVVDAIKWFESQGMPDLVFMDIQLADGLSFEIFQNVTVEAPIIFTTAYDQYAIQAFKVNSIDYLLKPIQKSDLQKALKKFTKSRHQLEVQPNVLRELMASFKVSSSRKSILVKEGSGFVKVNTSDILYFYSEDSISFGLTKDKRYIIEETIDQLFTSLDANEYFKINRGQIVSKSALQRIEPYFNHRLKLKIENDRGLEFVVSRSKTTDFKSWINS